jgi:multiple sugar transport system permease protein
MIRSRRNDILVAYSLVAPFLVVYALLFVYPAARMFMLAFTNAPLIGSGDWVGFKNFERLWHDRLFWTSVWNTLYFVLLSVVPSTIIGLLVAVAVNRLSGWLQSIVLAAFFLPYILPVSVVFRIWAWMFDKDFGIAQTIITPFTGGEHVSVFRTLPLFMPGVAFVTVWWFIGFNALLFIAGLRNIPRDLYEAAELDGAGHWTTFRRITWPLIWPITVLVMTIQLILQLKIFDQVYLFQANVRTDATMVMVEYVLKQAFQMNKGGLGAAASTVLFVLIVVVSVLQFQLLRARGAR